MVTKASPWLAGATMFFLSLTANALTVNFQAAVSTSGIPGSPPQAVNGTVSASAQSNPAPATHFGTEYAKAAASGHAHRAHVSAASYAFAQRVLGLTLPPNIIGYGESSFTDSLTVESGLPDGTEVTLKFRATSTVIKSAQGNYSGTVKVDLQVGSSAASTTWVTQMTDLDDDPLQSPEITVKTKVGARLYFTGKISARSSAIFYSMSTRMFDGSLSLTAEMNVERIDSESAVTVRSDSGAIFQAMP